MEMSTPAVCRMCLALDTRMYAIANTRLQEIYEKMTNILLQNDEGKPMMACYICRYLLLKSETFISRSVAADALLHEILNAGLQITEKSISMFSASPLNRLTMTAPDLMCCEVESAVTEVEIKIEGRPVKKEKDVEVEVEIEPHAAPDPEGKEEAVEEPPPLLEVRDPTSESDDDLPLQTFSSMKKRSTRNEKTRVGSAKKSVQLKADVSEITLTKEQQLEQLAERSKSLNYINSPYKCNLCYKGFVDARAWANHTEKHDERSGPHSCEICRMRYKTARHLRTHVATSHLRQYVCNKCHHRSHTANQAREHEKWHNGHTYECQLCSQAFRKPTSYLTHMRKRHPTEHVCNVCGESFVGRHGLLMHKSKAHWRDDEKNPTVQESEASSFCAECNIRFLTVDAWKRHVLTSLKHALGNENSVSCLVCGSVVPGASLRAHVREHEHTARAPRAAPADKPLQKLPCDQCGQSFVNRSKLQAHVRRIHLGLKYNKNIVCEVCGKKCTSNASLTYHQRTHTGEKPYSCATCSKRFADRNQLRIHGRTHTGERPYCCHACPKRFSQKPALNRHYRVHTGAKPYACQFCAKTFSQSNSLKLHVSAVHLKLPQNKKKPPPPAAEPVQDL